jgi:hypothetical protein
MRTTLLLIITVFNLAKAGPIKIMATNNPDQVQQIIETSSYPDLLQFVQNAYAESKAENDDEVTQYVYILALDQASLDKKIPLAIDFSLSQADLIVKQFGARAVLFATLKGAATNAAQRQQAVTKLKAELGQIATPNRDAFDFARSAANALIVLGDDTGLDVFLTDKQSVSNYGKKDGWNPSSDAAVFQSLKTQYEQRAADPNNANPDPDRIRAATYELCRLRRTQTKEIKPLQPLANLDHLLPK